MKSQEHSLFGDKKTKKQVIAFNQSVKITRIKTPDFLIPK